VVHQIPATPADSANAQPNGDALCENGEKTSCTLASTAMLLHKEITQVIIDSYFIVYNHLGFGFPEAIYSAALQHELRKAGLRVDREVSVRVHYDTIVLGQARLDMIVERKIVVETKALKTLREDAEDQVFSYLRATNLEVGLLLNFGPRPKIKRYLCTNDRKTGFDLREGTLTPFLR
jgi:GxxExxY protein